MSEIMKTSFKMKFLKLREGKGQVNALQYSQLFFLIHSEVFNNLTDETGSNFPLISHVKA